MRLLFLLLLGIIVSVECLTPSLYLTTLDKNRLKQVLNNAWVLDDIPSVHYAVNGYKLLNEPLSLSSVSFTKYFMGFYRKIWLAGDLFYIC